LPIKLGAGRSPAKKTPAGGGAARET